ncbi:hypothetical protein BH20BAC1_BH20BAC1_02250 [soil metagenome]
MFISGFSFVRNATKLYYPVRASIESILPLVDEFVIALGDGDSDDHTLEEIQKINSDKIKIIHAQWDIKKYPGHTEYAHQTDIAKDYCKGDWLFYLQSDEIIHEKYLQTIKNKCTQFLNNKEVEGLLFGYKHFWGDYFHYIVSHAWYSKEVRIIRNSPEIHAWGGAQSFRRIPDFDGKNYFQKKDTFKLKVINADAEVYHYGWVRPPELMQKKTISFTTDFKGDNAIAIFKNESSMFNYGDLNKLRVFKETHPKAMEEFIRKFNWQHQLYPQNMKLKKHKHNKLKYRFLSFVEENIFGGKQIANFKNYKLIHPKSTNQ